MKNILLIGLGRFGKHIAIQLNSLGHEIMAVDIDAVSYTHLDVYKRQILPCDDCIRAAAALLEKQLG